jgi:hypothetical protein
VFSEPGTAREEAERLVAAGLAFASLAANAHPEIATGSAACCVCPFCKLIEAVRDPDPQVVERLATGAGDLAVGVANLLRGFAAMGGRTGGDEWAAATDPPHSTSDTAAGAAPGTPRPSTPAPKKAAAKAVPRIVPESETPPTGGTAGKKAASAANPQPTRPVAKKAIKKVVPKPSPGASG